MTRVTLRLAASLAAFLPFAACASDAAKTPAAPATAKPARKLPPIYDTMMLADREITWKKSVCVASNRRLFINFGTNDCAPCRVVNDAMNEDKFQRAFLRQFVPSYIDVSPGSPNLKVLKDWGIDPAKGLPAAVILDEEGKLQEATKDGELAKEAAKGTEAVQLWILKYFTKDQ